MKIKDISMEIAPGMPVYKNKQEKKPVFTILSSHQKGDVYETRLAMDLHSGTHIDAPLHMLEDGETTEIYDLQQMVTPCKVIDLTDVEKKIQIADLKKHDITKNDFLLFKTQNSYKDDFTTDFIYLDAAAAKFLAGKEIKGVGIDSLGIERAQSGHPTHKTLLGARIIILEGLALKDVDQGSYKLIVLPLKIAKVEAAPARAILIES